MNRLSAFIGGGVALLSACDAAVATRSEPESVAPAFAATTSTSNTVIQFNEVDLVPCANGGAGELVSVSGDLHVLLHTTVSNSGQTVDKLHFQPQGISGVGLTTGTVYQATGVTQEIDLDPGTDTFVNNFRLIAKAPGNNLLIHQLFHVTVNANGVVTATVDNQSIECK